MEWSKEIGELKKKHYGKPVKILAGKAKSIYYINREHMDSSVVFSLELGLSETDDHEFDWSDFSEDTVERILDFLALKSYPVIGKSTEHYRYIGNPGPDQIAWEGRCAVKDFGMDSCTVYGIYRGMYAGALNGQHLQLGRELERQAEIYCFAHRNMDGVESGLQNLALQNLLAVFQAMVDLELEMFPYLENVVQSIYTETRTQEGNLGRKVLSRLVGNNYMAILQANDKLEELLYQQRDFALHVVKVLETRIAEYRDQIESARLPRDALKSQAQKIRATLRE